VRQHHADGKQVGTFVGDLKIRLFGLM
jgi:hypothetical protein